MICIPEHVENPVYQEPARLICIADPKLTRLTFCAIQIHVDLSINSLAIPKWKRNDVRDVVVIQKSPVDALNETAPHKYHRHTERRHKFLF